MTRFVLAGTLLAAALLAGCIFQNSPLSPNQPPTIQHYTPQTTFFSLTAPDSCVFSIEASDPDGDDLAYSFAIGDSILSSAGSVKFRAVRAGDFTIRGEARDGTSEAFHEWHVTVLERDNQPPVITWFQPDQSHVACAVGETLEFHFKANDDHPASLECSYLLDGALLYSGSPDLINRFMERGDFLLQGVAWDGQYGDTTSWHVSVTGFPDTIAPAAILDLDGAPGDIDGSIALDWTAPGDDGMEGRAASYVVKTSVYPILTEDDWTMAEGKPGEPVPSVAGTREHMTIRNLVSASYVYVTMRAVDDFFNPSPLGNCVKVLVRGIDITGRTLNGITGEPVAGLPVFTSLRGDTSDAEGRYLLKNVPSYTAYAMMRDENVYGSLGSWFDVSMPIAVTSQTLTMDFYAIPAFVLENARDPDPYEGRWLSFFKQITLTDGYMGRSTVYKGWNHWPLLVYNPPMTYGGIDLAAACSRSLSDWERLTGIDLFTEVPTESGADVIIRYDTATVDRHHVATPGHNPDGTPSLKEIWIFTKDAEVPYWRYADMIFTHELGHIIGLDHSKNTGHLMVGMTTPRVEEPSLDEIRVVQVLLRLPNFFDYKCILED